MSSNLSKGSQQVMDQLSALRSQLEPIHAGFQGAAASAFQQLWEEWQQSGTRLQNSLDGLSRILQTAALNAAEMEENNRRMMQQG